MSSNLLTLLDNFFDDTRLPAMVRSNFFSVPAINVKEYPDRYEISVTVPGLDPAKVKVELAERVLTISYVHEEEKKEEKSELLREEYRHYSWSRAIALPKNVDEESVQAKSARGELVVSVKKLPETQPKSIKVETAE
jgi:HSP20 family protein